VSRDVRAGDETEDAPGAALTAFAEFPPWGCVVDVGAWRRDVIFTSLAGFGHMVATSNATVAAAAASVTALP
jgi:hypothetical protein